ncbi:MAG: DUF4350 domain-containing protein [Armatimonadetes bacterium]|nr:DUF4350 domain-containing protein [Armatimonadota bacterium]
MTAVNRKDIVVVGVMLTVTVLLAILLSLASSPRQRDTLLSMSSSSYSARTRGLKALYRGLTQAGYRTQRFRKPLTHLSNAGTLFIVQPDEALSQKELTALRRWVSSGNTLVLAADVFASEEAASPPTSDANMDRATGFQDRSLSLHPTLPSPRLFGVRTLSSPGESRIVGRTWNVLRREWVKDKKTETPIVQLLGDSSGMAVGMSRMGRGTIYTLSVPSVMGNKWLGAGDNIRFLLNIIGPPQTHRAIIFDEFHHGYHDVSQEPLFNRFTWLGVWQATLALGLWLIFRATRFGQIRRPQRKPRERTEYVTALALLLERARANALARRTLGDRFVQDLAHEIGLAPSASAQTLAERAARRGADGRQIRELVEAARRADTGDENSDTLHLAQQWRDTVDYLRGAKQQR